MMAKNIPKVPPIGDVSGRSFHRIPLAPPLLIKADQKQTKKRPIFKVVKRVESSTSSPLPKDKNSLGPSHPQPEHKNREANPSKPEGKLKQSEGEANAVEGASGTPSSTNLTNMAANLLLLSADHKQSFMNTDGTYEVRLDPVAEVQLMKNIEKKFHRKLSMYSKERTKFFCGLAYLLERELKKSEGKVEGKGEEKKRSVEEEEEDGGKDKDIFSMNFYEILYYGTVYMKEQEAKIWKQIQERIVKSALTAYHEYPSLRLRLQQSLQQDSASLPHQLLPHPSSPLGLLRRGLTEAFLFDTLVRSRYIAGKMLLGDDMLVACSECPPALSMLFGALERCKPLLPSDNSEV